MHSCDAAGAMVHDGSTIGGTHRTQQDQREPPDFLDLKGREL